MFEYAIVYSQISDFDGSHAVSSFSTTNRNTACSWLKSDRLIDLQVSMKTAPVQADPSDYDLIVF